MNRGTIAIAVLGIIAGMALSGCATTSRVHFEEPVGSRLQMAGEQYKLPVALDLKQLDNPLALHSNTGGRPVRMSLTDGTGLKGYLYVYTLRMDQVEALAEVTFRLTADQIAKLKSGHAVTVFGYSARQRPVYKINLGLDR